MDSLLTPEEISIEWERIKRDHPEEYELLIGRKKFFEEQIVKPYRKPELKPEQIEYRKQLFKK